MCDSEIPRNPGDFFLQFIWFLISFPQKAQGVRCKSAKDMIQ